MKLMHYRHPASMAGLIRRSFDDSFFTDRLDAMHNGVVTPANIMEDEKGYRIEMPVPGLSREDLSISLEKNLLTISTRDEGQAADRNYVRREFFQPRVRRSFTISERIDADNIHAQCVNGILSVDLPLRAEDLKLRQRREIEVA